MYRLPEFERAVTEHFDLSDKETFSYLKSLEEADQSKVLTALTSKLYDHLIEKVDDIDFGDIPKSRGDITKLPNYKKIIDCKNIIRDILLTSKQDPESILIIDSAIKYLEQYKEIFIRGYQLNMEMPMVIYNTTVLSIYSSISVLIASCIEFIKSTDDTGFDIALDRVQLKKTKDSLLFKNLKMLNSVFENGMLPEALDAILKQNVKNLTGNEMLTGLRYTAKIITMILFIVPLVRELTYYFYYSRVKVSDYFDSQAALMQMNAYNLAAKGSNDEKDIKEIQAKQLRIADRFKKIANSLEVKKNKAEVAAEKETRSLNKKMKISDLSDSLW